LPVGQAVDQFGIFTDAVKSRLQRSRALVRRSFAGGGYLGFAAGQE
jgi:hypothetical protein